MTVLNGASLFCVDGHCAMFCMIGQAHWLTVSAFMVWIQIVIQANSFGVTNSIGSGVFPRCQSRELLYISCTILVQFCQAKLKKAELFSPAFFGISYSTIVFVLVNSLTIIHAMLDGHFARQAGSVVDNRKQERTSTVSRFVVPQLDSG